MDQKNVPESATEGREFAPPDGEASLSVSELRFRTMFEQSPLGMEIFSPDGLSLHANKAWEKLWDTSVEELKGYNILEDEQIIRKGLMPYVKAGFAGEAVSIPPTLYDPSDIGRVGRARWVESFIYPIKTSDDVITEVILVLSDVTERMEAVEALRENEERVRFALEAAHTGTWDWDVETGAVKWSSNVESIHGLPPGSLGETFGDYLRNIHPEDVGLVLDSVRASIESGAVHSVEYRIVCPDGTVRWIEGKGTPVIDEGGRTVRLSGVCMDVTPRKVIEARVREQSETLETLNRIGRVISGELDFQKLLQAVTDAATELCGARFGAFFYNVRDDEDPSYRLFTLSGAPREHFANFPPPRATDLFGPTFRGEGIVRLDDVKEDPRYWKNSPYHGLPPGHLPVASYLAVPVVSRSGEVIGGLFFGHPDRGVFTEREERRVAGLAAQAAVAIDNARLFEFAQRERARVEASEKRYRAVTEAIPQMVWVANPDGSYDYFNRRWYEYTGLSEEQSVGSGWRAAIHPDDLQMCVEKWNHAVRTGDAFEIEHRVRRGSDSAYRWQLGRALPLKDDEQNVFKWFGTWTDIEDQKRAEQTQRFLAEASTVLASSLNYDVTLSRVAHLAVPWIADWCSVDILEDGRLKRLEIAHSDPSKVELVRQLQERYPPDPEHSGPLSRALNTGRSEVVSRIPDELLIRVARDEGHLEILRGLRLRSYMIVPLVARNRTLGTITFVTSESGREYTKADLGVAEDLARRAAVAVDNSRLYRESQEASRLKDEFLATVSHELRTPLNAILGWARMLRGSKMSEEEAAQATEVIERNARSQAQLIEDLLDVSRIISGKLRLNVRPIDPVEIVGLAIESVRPAAEAKGVLLETMLDPSAGPVSGDPDRLQQVVWNLLSNSIKFTPEGGRVRVRLERKPSRIEIVVSDTGQGINPDFLPFVFERFRQADSTLTRAFGGLGLGLSIVRHLVEMHGGVVTAESEGEGKGATFAVSLPLLAVRQAGPADREVARPHQNAVRDDFSFDAPPDLTGVRVLVVDDDPDARVLLTALLSQCHAEISACASASEAFERIEAWTPDVVVSDIEMPEEDGYSLIRRIRGLEGGSVRRVPAVALTAHARPEDRLRALSSGYQMHVPKPVEPAELAIVIANLVRHGRD